MEEKDLDLTGAAPKERIDDGGSAFPLNTENNENGGAFVPEPGMTLRDYFAGQALTGIIARSAPDRRFEYADAADDAYLFADAMIKQKADQ